MMLAFLSRRSCPFSVLCLMQDLHTHTLVKYAGLAWKADSLFHTKGLRARKVSRESGLSLLPSLQLCVFCYLLAFHLWSRWNSALQPHCYLRSGF